MKKKTDFLDQLKKRLEEINYKDVDNIVEYYDELIEDKKENKKTEASIIKEIGNIDDIVKNLKVEKTIEEAEKNPSIAKSSKALIAFLGILSIPMLIPAVAIVFSVFVTIFALFITVIAVIGSFIISSIAIIVGLFIGVFTQHIPIATVLIFLGIALILLVLSIELFKVLMITTKSFSKWSVAKLKNIMKRRNKR